MFIKYTKFILAVYGTWILFFLCQKPLFMGFYHQAATGLSMADYARVVFNGFRLDSSVSAYLTIFPFLLLWIGMWRKVTRMKAILNVYFLLSAFIIASIFCVDVVLYGYWQFRLDATLLFYLRSPANAMASIPGWMLIAVGGAILLYTALMYEFLRRCVVSHCPSGPMTMPWKATGSVLWALIGGVLFVLIRGGVTTSTTNIGRVYFSSNQFLNHSAINPCFSLLASVSKSEDFAAQFDFYPEDERAARFKALFPPAYSVDDTLYVLNTKRPNVLVILLESFSANVIGSLGGISGITPNFNRLSDEGIFFTRCYSSSFRTDRGTVATLSGYPGQPTTSIMKMPAKSRSLPSLASSLAKEGYVSDVLYGGDIDFTNMRSYFLGTGYTRLTSDVDFPVSSRLSKWGAQDDVTFDYLYKMLKARNNRTDHWHTCYLTLSTHDPFEVPYHKYEQPYLNTMAYADSCLGIFIDKLKKEPVWKDLLIIMIADHGYRYPDTFKEYEPRRFHIPMLWLGGAVKAPRKVEMLVSQTDLVATVLGQMELPHQAYAFSRHIFSSAYRNPFLFYTFNNGFAVIDSTGASVYDNVGEYTLYQKPENGNELRLAKGKAILQTLYDDLGNR